MLLIIETITWKPHIETAIEIALRERDSGREVIYCNLRRGLPTCEDRMRVHALLDLPGSRQSRAQRVLRENGVAHITPEHNRDEILKAEAEARDLIARCSTADEFRSLSYADFYDIGWGALSSAASVQLDSSVSPESNRALLTKFLAASILIFNKTRRLVEELKPSEIMVFNGRFATTRAAIRAAESMGIPWKMHERGADKDHYWVADCLPHDLDRIQQMMQERWTPEHESAGHAFFQARRNRIERDWHSFARNQEQGRLPIDIKPEEVWVTFFTSSEDEMIAIGDRFNNDRFPTQVGAIHALADAVATIPGMRLCVRVHPHVALKSQADQRKWSNLNLPGVLVVGPKDKVDTYALIDRSHAVCTYGSTVGVEATYWGRPSLLFGPSYYDQLGVSTLAMDSGQIREFLRNPVLYSQERTLLYGAFWELLGQPYRYYRAENLHRGTICGVDLDGNPVISAAKWLSSRLFPAKH